jgi:hypothetical protein
MAATEVEIIAIPPFSAGVNSSLRIEIQRPKAETSR